MAAVPRVIGSKLLVQIGNGATPTETFAHDCLINTARGIKFTAETNEDIMPDCTNPDAPAWKAVTKDGLMATISGAGKLNATSVAAFYAWLTGANSKNCRFMLNLTGANGGGYWQGAFHLTEFEVSASDNKSTAECQISLVSDGPLTFTANA